MRARQLSPQFIEAFVKTCTDKGLSVDATEDYFRQHAMNYFLATPGIYEGFHQKVASYRGELTRAQMARYMTPAVLAKVAECRVRYADDPLSESLRFELNLPDPSWDTVEAETRKVASALNDSLSYYAQLPMNQKVLIASLAGAGIGGLSRAVHPTIDDQLLNRGKLNRATRGVFRGGTVGAGTAAGSELGEIAGAEAGGAGGVIPGMLAGGIGGGLLTNKLTR
jgi:hypothetical protein